MMGVQDADESHGRIPSETGHQKLKSVDKVNLTNFIGIPPKLLGTFFLPRLSENIEGFQKKSILKKLAFLDNLRM